MIDHTDFMQYAEIDLENSIIVFDRNHYGTAAYFSQQGLEKYVKAYFLKSHQIQDVRVLGHLQYHEIIKEIIEIFEEQKKKEEDSDIIKVLDSTISHYKTLEEMFNKVRTSIEYKILFWKASMKIELNKKEKDMLNGIRVKSELNTSAYISTVMNYLSSDSFQKNFADKKTIPPELKAEIPPILLEYTQSLTREDANISSIRDKLLEKFKPHLYGAGNKSLSKDDSNLVIKLTALDKSFDWYSHVLLSYPHEEIGRYPIMIENNDAYTLYRENKDNLLEFINAIRAACANIRSSII